MPVLDLPDYPLATNKIININYLSYNQ